MAPHDCLSLGLDLGGTQVRAALVEDGKVLRRASARTDAASGPKGVMTQFRQLATEVSNEIDFAEVQAVGICTPGPLDTRAGVVEQIPTLPGWEGFPLRDQLATAFGRPVVVENDGIAAAFGEWQYGAGRGLNHLVYVTVSTGIGGGVVVDGRLMHGRKGMAAHIGHFRVAADGPVCACGMAGCFEALASGTALGRRAGEAALGNPAGYLGAQAGKGPVETWHAVEGARLGDPACLALMAEEADWLGVGFTGLLHLFSPERIVMGGGVSQAFDLLADGIRSRIERDAMASFKAVPVVPAQLGDNSGLVGAATLAMAIVACRS